MGQHTVILGGGYAGIMAAQRLGAAGVQTVTLINNRAGFVERIRLHQLAAGEPRVEHSLRGLLRRKGVEFLQGHVRALDLDAGQVIYSDGAADHALRYDSLVYALGSRTGSPPSDRLFTLDVTSVPALAARLSVLPEGARVVIVGGGLTGIEVAAEFAEAYPRLSLTLVTRGHFGEHFSAKGQAHLFAALDRLRVTICDGLKIDRVTDGALITERGAIPFDVGVWTAGFSVSGLARESGLAVNECGQMLVDRYLRSLSHPNVYGAGDAAYPVEASVPIRMGCVTAMPLGGHAADNINARLNGEEEKPFAFRYYWRCISLGRGDGLVQMVSADDTPREQILTGRGGALFKEMICRMTFNVLRLERFAPGLYRVPA